MKCNQCGAQIEGDFCPYCGAKSEEVETKEAIVEQINNQSSKADKKAAKPKKPFYKKWWFWVLVAIVVINIFSRLGGNNNSSVDISEFEWNNMALAEIIPEPESNLGSHLMNSEDYLSVDVHEISKEAYKEYVNGCREKGFTVDMSETDGYYSASNNEGYELMLYYFDDEQRMSIDLSVPSEVVEETTETEAEISESESESEKISFTLVAGEKGEYGESFTINKGTEFEETYYVYRVPVGTYTVTNVGEYMNQFNVYGDEIHVTEEGWEEPTEIFYVKVLDVGKSDTVTIGENQYIEIHEPGNFKLEMQ